MEIDENSRDEIPHPPAGNGVEEPGNSVLRSCEGSSAKRTPNPFTLMAELILHFWPTTPQFTTVFRRLPETRSEFKVWIRRL